MPIAGDADEPRDAFAPRELQDLVSFSAVARPVVVAELTEPCGTPLRFVIRKILQIGAIAFNGSNVKNPRAQAAPQSMLGRTQKAWFLSRLRNSTATWKLWANSVAVSNWRAHGLASCGAARSDSRTSTLAPSCSLS